MILILNYCLKTILNPQISRLQCQNWHFQVFLLIYAFLQHSTATCLSLSILIKQGIQLTLANHISAKITYYYRPSQHLHRLKHNSKKRFQFVTQTEEETLRYCIYKAVKFLGQNYSLPQIRFRSRCSVLQNWNQCCVCSKDNSSQSLCFTILNNKKGSRNPNYISYVLAKLLSI